MKLVLKGFDEFSDDLKRSPKLFEKPFKKALELSGKKVRTDARSNVAVDTGRLKRSINFKVEKDLVRVGPNVRYGLYVEEGTKAHFPPIRPIRKWSTKRGLDPYAVAYAIGRKGTKAQPFLLPAIKDNQQEIFNNFEEALEIVLKKIAR